MGLYLSEREIATEVLGKGRETEWSALAIVLGREGLPPIDPLMGGRYWRAVLAFFDKRHGLAKLAPPTAPSGGEDWSWRKQKRRDSHGEPEKTADVLPIGSRTRGT